MSININFPYQFDDLGSTAQTGEEEHIRDLIKQVLFTSPGERVNRPTFGCGLMQLVFAPNSDELAASTQFTVQGALQHWLGDLVQVEQVTVANNDSTLDVTVQYLVLKTRERRIAEFSREL